MERLFGVETEYAFAALDSQGTRVSSGKVLPRLMDLAARRLSSLPDELPGGMFLQNGARLYVDHGQHPEFSTPECANPWDVVRYIQSGERILTSLANALERERSEVSEAVVLRSNVDYGGTGSTWGCHESYLHRRNPSAFAEQLIPHLVSRIIYTGAGGFNSLNLAGLEFTLSPRVWHLQHAISNESTHNRGIFHTKNESLSSTGYHRLHIVCGESLCSELAAWLKVGATALIVALIDGGVCPGEGMQLLSPVGAMRTFARDPHCSTRARLRNGRQCSALDIQWHYLRQAEAHLHDKFMPPFAPAVCEQWRATLEALEHAPESVATQLDWAIKFSLYTRRARRHGMTWDAVSSWTQVLSKLGKNERKRVSGGELVPLDTILQGSTFRAAKELKQLLQDHDLKWDDVTSFVKLQKELFEIDTRFGQLGSKGIFAAMDSAGVLSHRVLGVDNVEHALENPPAIGRARLRGETVRRLADERDCYITTWEGIRDCERRQILDLSDPFLTSVPKWEEWTVGEGSLAAVRGRLGRRLRL